MRAELEKIELQSGKRSFRFFKVESERFKPFWHFHPELELILILSGSGTRYVGNSILPFAAPDLVLLGANLPHQWVSDQNTNGKCEALVIQFSATALLHLPECKVFSPLFTDSEYGLQIPPTEAMLSAMKHFANQTGPGGLAVLIKILEIIGRQDTTKALSTKRYQAPSTLVQQNDRTQMVTSFILENMQRKLTIEEMADISHMAPQSFCRWFKSATGNSFISFLNRSRIERACHQLASGENNIQHVAFDSGFESISQFNRTFKNIKGVTPSVYRRTLQ